MTARKGDTSREGVILAGVVERTPYEVEVSMSGFDVFFNTWMTLAALLVFLRIKKFIGWDWGIVLAPVCIGVLMKGVFVFLNRA
jgi:ABC-type uncharacterized transport system permease subunit